MCQGFRYPGLGLGMNRIWAYLGLTALWGEYLESKGERAGNMEGMKAFCNLLCHIAYVEEVFFDMQVAHYKIKRPRFLRNLHDC